MIVEVREPAKALAELENVREAITQVFRELCVGTNGHMLQDIMWAEGAIGDVIENYFVVRRDDEG